MKETTSNRQKFCRNCWKEKEKELRKDINKRYYKKIKTVQKTFGNPNISTFFKMKNIHKNTFYYSNIGTYNRL